MNIRGIAQLAGVSVASVSRALSGKNAEKVSPAMRERILRICEQQRYFPNMHMVRIYHKLANTIAFLYPTDLHHTEDKIKIRMDDNLSAAILGAQEELAKTSTFLIIAATTKEFVSNREHLKLHRGKTVDGMLAWGWTESENYIYELIEERIPLVMLQGKLDDENVSSVIPQDAEGMGMLVDHVVARGHRKIALATPSIGSLIGRERYYGALNALLRHGLDPSWCSSARGYSVDSGRKACKEILGNSPETTCILGANDLSAVGVIEAATEMGRSVPESLSVTGADGLELYMPYTLTTYVSQSYDIGKEGARLLKSLLDKPGRKAAQIRVPVRLIEGNTVREPHGR